jgi:hypothetical protein
MNNKMLIKDTDAGILVFGYNDDVDAAETIWGGGGTFPWASVTANAATTIVSASADDDSAGTGLRTVQVEGLVSETIGDTTGYRIYRETVTLDGTSAVTLDNEYAFVYRLTGLTAGSGGENAGAISVKHGATVIANILAGANNSEMAVMMIPHFTSIGTRIHGAWALDWHAHIAKTSSTYADMAMKIAPDSNNVFGIKCRAVASQTSPAIVDCNLPQYLKSGYRIELAADAVSAADTAISGGFELLYDLG